MRLITVCEADWCNVGFNVAKALKMVGINAESIKTCKHNFGYSEESRIVTHSVMLEEIRAADIVFIMNSNLLCLELCKRANKKNIFVYHTGTNYRRNPEKYNLLFNPYILQAFTDQTEFIGLGMKYEYYLFLPINTEKIKPTTYDVNERILFGHFPSNPIIKGTAIIRKALSDLKKKYPDRIDFIIDEKIVPNDKQLERMNRCDVYVELFAPLHEGNKYGCFGVTAMEAAALGKVVITNHTTPEVYTRFYGRPTMFYTPQTEIDLAQDLFTLAQMPKEKIMIKKQQTRQWVEEYHSFMAYGSFLKELLNL